GVADRVVQILDEHGNLLSHAYLSDRLRQRRTASDNLPVAKKRACTRTCRRPPSPACAPGPRPRARAGRWRCSSPCPLSPPCQLAPSTGPSPWAGAVSSLAAGASQVIGLSATV